MKNNKNYPIALFNGTVATTNGLFSVEDISVEEAKKYIDENGFISAVGHQATAAIMAEAFNKDIKMNRIQFHQSVGQLAIAFKLDQRPAEGVILDKSELEAIGYSFKLMKRLE